MKTNVSWKMRELYVLMLRYGVYKVKTYECYGEYEIEFWVDTNIATYFCRYTIGPERFDGNMWCEGLLDNDGSDR